MQVVFYLNNYTSTDDLVTAVGNIRYGGYPPNLPDALAVARTSVFATSNGARQDSSVLKLAVVFITETMSRYRNATLEEGWAAADMDIGIVTVGIGRMVERSLLLSITSYPSYKNTFIVQSAVQVIDLAEPIKRIICSGTSVTQSVIYACRCFTPY